MKNNGFDRLTVRVYSNFEILRKMKKTLKKSLHRVNAKNKGF